MAKPFATVGAKVYITDPRLDVLEKAAASVMGIKGPWSGSLHMDVTDEQSINAGAKHIGGVDGMLDILVNETLPLPPRP